MIRAWLVVALLGGCAKKEEPAGGATNTPPEVIPAAEIKRGRDACEAYVAKVCTCAQTNTALAEQCKLAKALPEALEVDREIGNSPELPKKDAIAITISLRKTIKECIEQTAKLPAAGCP
jgi:hypothetical protein